MPRPILSTPAGTRVELSAVQTRSSSGATDRASLEKRLRLRRSPDYVEALGALDGHAGTGIADEIAELLTAIRAELPEVTLEDGPLGIVARCYLGAPYEVHTLDVLGGIVRHYRRGEPLPVDLEPARGLANHGAYAFVEVYANCLRAVAPDGHVSVVPR